MENKSLLDWISHPGYSESHTTWANGKRGSICDPENNCIYRFIELTEEGNYKYGYEDKRTKSPYIAFGIVAWWLKFRRQKTIVEVFESYYQMRLQQYREQREKQADSWDVKIEEEFLEVHHVKQEQDLIIRSEAIYDYLHESEINIVKSVVRNYLSYLDSISITNSNNDMTNLSQNEILTLLHLSDEKDHSDPPNGLTCNQFYAALKKLQAYEMVRAAFLTGEEVCSSHIRAKGKAALDDLRMQANEELKQEIKNNNIVFMSQISDNNDFEALLEESLFAEWADVLCQTNSMFGNNGTASFIWSRAKHYALGIADSKKPVLKFRNRCHEIRNEFKYDEMDTRYLLTINPYEQVYSIVVGCVYTMIVLSADDNVAQQIIDNIPVYGTVPYCNIQNIVNAIVEKIANGDIECDYDYTKENGGITEEDCTENDSESVGVITMSEVKKKDLLIQQLQEQLDAYESGPIAIEPHDKVRLEIVMRLLEESGADFEKFGNKAEAGRMAEFITGLPSQTCKNYPTNRDLNTSHHSEEVLKANTSLKKLGINWQL